MTNQKSTIKNPDYARSISSKHMIGNRGFQSFTPFPSLGFTLIELLVVITIIGILATIFFGTFTASQRQARDSQRKFDLKNIQAALEQYKADTGNYPITYAPPGVTTCGGWDFSNGCPYPQNNWITELVPKYIQKMPNDPLYTNTGAPPWTGGFIYGYFSGAYCTVQAGQSYLLVAHLENASDPAATDASGKNSVTIGGCTWPGAGYPGSYVLTSP